VHGKIARRDVKCRMGVGKQELALNEGCSGRLINWCLRRYLRKFCLNVLHAIVRATVRRRWAGIGGICHLILPVNGRIE
jgi:hypothetical protein